MKKPRFTLASAPVVALAYGLITIVMTWPLAGRMNTEIAWDLGDPVLTVWIMTWTAGQVLATLRGDFNAIHDYWNGNIFYPEHLTIAYSEHFTPQMLQTLPIYAITGNMVLCYNLVHLSTYVLSGLAAYLLVRDLTERPAAAFLAGLAFAFTPYRLSQSSHLMVLSSYWMPLALLGFRRYFVTGRTRPLVGAAAAVALQNLSCGYYLLFFSPFAAAYCLYEMASRGLVRSWRVWRSLILAAVAVAVVTYPFVSPYLKLRRLTGMGIRSYEESVMFSADTYAFGTISGFSRLWGERLRAFPKGESEGFLGFAILAFAGVGLAWGLRRAARQAGVSRDRTWQKALLAALGVALAIDVGLMLTMFVTGSLPFLIRSRPWRDTDPLLLAAVILCAALTIAVPAVRRFLRGVPGSTFGFYAVAALVAAVLTLGPRIESAGRLLGTGPYYWLYRWVPGFDGVRVPARYLMLVALFLSVLAGLGAARILAKSRRVGLALVAAGCLAILAESWMAPTPTNVRLAPHWYELTERKLDQGSAVSPIYTFVRDAPGRMVLIEFPFGEPAYELLATYYAGYHRRPLANGFSGFFPETYLRRATFLTRIPFDLDAATKALASAKATHALVHEAAFPDGRGHEVTDWLRSTGATLVMEHGPDKLLLLH